MNSTAKLMTLMTARGMFSRHRNNLASHRSDTPTLMKTLEPQFWFNSSGKNFQCGRRADRWLSCVNPCTVVYASRYRLPEKSCWLHDDR
jgi:hypothetical protein